MKQNAKRNQHFNEIRILGFEFVRTLLYWSLALLVALPARLAAADPATSPQALAEPSADPQTQKFGLLSSLTDQLVKLSATDPNRETIKKQVDQISEELQTEILSELTPFETEYAALQKEADDANHPIDEAKRAQILERARHVLSKKRLLGIIIAREGQPTVGFLADSSLGETKSDQIMDASFKVENGPVNEGEDETPERLHERVLGSMIGGAKSFSSQYFTFSMAMGFIALSQIGIQNGLQAAGLGDGAQTDPNAVENWMKHTFDLMGAEGFAFFMAGNHATIKLLKSAMYREIPAHMLPAYLNYIGMVTGSLTQSVFSDLMQDKDVWKCVKPYYNSALPHDPAACAKMRENWITKGKVLQYTPSVLSMVGSTALSATIRSSLSGISDPEILRPRAGASRFAHIKFKGAVLISKTRGGQLLAKMVKLFPARLVPVGDFVMFLAMDTYVTQEPINHAWQNLRMNYVDVNAWLNKKGMHAEFFWPKENSLQAIANAFDVEATTPYTAHTYLMDFYRKMQESGWKKPTGPEACVPKNLAKEAKVGDASQKWFWQRWAEEKSQSQLTCEVLARPSDLITRYGEMNREWRGVVMSPFSTAQNNWITMLTQFTTVYGASLKLATHLAGEKFKIAYKGSTAKPDLSRETLAKVIGSPLPKEGEEDAAGEQEKANSVFLDGSWMPTPELVDFVVAGFTCGPEANLDPTKVSVSPLSRWFDTVYSVFARQIASPSYMTTPWGSSLHFVPPKLTNKNRAICENVQNGFFDTMNITMKAITGYQMPTLSAKSSAVMNPFTGPFKDGEGQTHATMADYLFENLDPDVYKPVGNYSGFSMWWMNHLTQPITPVYAKYGKVYDKLIDQRFFPLLFDQTYKYGCRTPHDEISDKAISSQDPNAQGCSQSSNAYRVGNGFFSSVEIEMRNYMRGLYSLYASTFSKAENSTEQKKAFQELANSLLGDIQVQSADDLRSKAFEQKLAHAEESLKAMTELIASRLNAPLAGKTVNKADEAANSKFRLEMLKSFQEQIAKVMAEENSQIELVKLWNFTGGASTRGPVQRVNTPVSASPLKRVGG